MKAVRLSNFYIRSSLFVTLSLTGAFFNYALYPVLVRILNTKEFGNFAVIVAISNQILGILLAFNIISIYVVKTHDEAKAREHSQTIQKYLIWFFLIITTIVLIFSPFLKTLLKIQDLSSFIVLALILIIAIPGVIWTGYLQGNKELVRVGGYNLSAAIAKFIFAILLAWAFGSIGGLLGILGGAIVGLVVLKIIHGVKLPSLGTLFTKSKLEDKQFIFNLKKYILMCIFVVGLLSFLQNYDIILAKALFNPSQAGVYSGISILSNALYYVCFLIIWIILPEIKVNDTVNNNRLLYTGYRLLAFLSVITVLFEVVFKQYITKILLGSGFKDQGSLLIFASLYQLTLVAITMYVYYLMVNRQRRGTILVMLTFSSCLVFPLLFKSTPLAMIKLLWLSLIIGSFTYLILIKLRRNYLIKTS